MVVKNLKNKPLLEAIFNVRWELQERHEGLKIDPNYRILIGRLYNKVEKEYPFYEQLPTANMPDEIAGYVPQYWFRKTKGDWPLIQLGPGIVTLNETKRYVWDDFRNRISFMLDALFECYPDSSKNLKINSLSLRYIDAIDFDYDNNDILGFLKEKLKTNIQLYDELFTNTGVSKTPLEFDFAFSFPSENPKGAMKSRFFRSKKKDSANGDLLMMETQIQSGERDTPNTKKDIISWVDIAHNLTEDWFFKLIDGDLLEKFK